MKKHDELLVFGGFLALAVITAHILKWTIGESYALYSYPAIWLLALVVLAIASPSHDTATAHTQLDAAKAATRKD